MDVEGKLENYSFFDGAILSHGFTRYMRDYEIVAEVSGAYNKDGSGLFSYRFTHCVQASYTTNLWDDTWRASWADLYTDYDEWKQAGAPDGFVFGVRWAGAYLGLTLVENSALARDWSERLGWPMYEATIETNVYSLDLVFHDVVITRLSDETPTLDRVNIPIEP